MSISETVISALREEKERDGISLEELSRRHNVNFSLLQRLLNGPAQPLGISVKKLEAMFPHADIVLNGLERSPSGDAIIGSAGVIKDITNSKIKLVQHWASCDMINREHAIAGVLGLGLDDASAVRVMSYLRGLDK